jgi:hypothetical protein
MDRKAVGRLRLAVMSVKNSKPGSTRPKTIVRNCNGVYVVARDEDSVTRVYPLHIVKANSLRNFVVEFDRARVVLEAATTDVATITGVTATTDLAAITGMATAVDVATITGMAATTGMVEDAHALPGVRNSVVDDDWSMQCALEDALER